MAAAAARAYAMRRAREKEKEKEKKHLTQQAKFLLNMKLNNDQKMKILNHLKEHDATAFLAKLVDGNS